MGGEIRTQGLTTLPDQHEKPRTPDMTQRGAATWQSLALRNAALVCIAAYFCNLALDDIRDEGRVTILKWSSLRDSFSPTTLKSLLILWLGCNASLILVNLGFRCWRRWRKYCHPQARGLPACLWDGWWLSLAVALHATLLAVPPWAASRLALPASATCALCCEQTRLLMKSYSYLREQVRHHQESKDDGGLAANSCNSSLSHLVYFMFAPTLVYKRQFERLGGRVRWESVARQTALFLAAIFTMVVVAGRGALRPLCSSASSSSWTSSSMEDDMSGVIEFLHFHDHHPQQQQTGVDMVGDEDTVKLAVLRFMVLLVRAAPAGAVLMAGMGVALHTWHKAFAELLRFGQQDFTKPWWNAASFDAFFRDWNLFVKAWLYRYVYKDLQRLGCGPVASRILTVVLSACWHEYILAASLGYVVPFCAVGYIASAIVLRVGLCKFQQGAFGNLFVLLTLAFGNAAYLAFYFTESMARMHCPAPDAIGHWDLFIPRSLYCSQPFMNCTFL